ncbi:hypothetical protein Tco_1098011, partial [Tanacetum coccineum]
NQSLLLQYSRDGYVIEGELKEYEDSCEKSSVQIKFKVKDFIQAIKESSCKRRSKLAFENADFEFESRVDTFRDKEIYLVIQGEKIISGEICYKVFLNFHKEFSAFSSFKEKENDRLLQNQVFKNKEEVVIKNTIRIVPK